MPDLSDPGPVVARFAQVREAAAARYGPDSQAVGFLLYEELISMRTMLAADHRSAAVRSRVDELVAVVQARFHAGGVREPARAHHRAVAADPMVIEYDRERFDELYRRSLEATGLSALKIRDRRHALSALTIGGSYLYAVDDEGALRVWPEARSLADMMFGWTPGRPRDPGRVVHPMLVPDRLRVRAAGELVLVGSATRLFVIANLRSGHFRPPACCAAEFCRSAMDVLELDGPGDIDVFTMPKPVRHDLTIGMDDEPIQRQPVGHPER